MRASNLQLMMKQMAMIDDASQLELLYKLHEPGRKKALQYSPMVYP